MYIQRFTNNSVFAHLRPFDAHLCTGCGTCSYVCPSKLNVAGTVARAKAYARAHFVMPQETDDEEAKLLDT
jgi:Na+-translocating ferredoxin:NAD+ oxidoreductase RnfC subunit